MAGLELGLDGEFLTRSLAAVLLVIVVSAILQDDFTCLTVGMYVSTGDLLLLPSLAACFLGTLLGDFFWFFSGRLFGAAFLQRRPIKWIVSPAHLERARDFFAKHGASAILLSRFLPLIRTSVQVSAGLFAGRVWICVFCFVMAAAVYAPLLVVGSALLGRAVNVYVVYERYGHLALFGVAIAVWLALLTLRLVVRRRV